MSKKKFDPKYIEDANKRLWQILNDKKEFDDWTQIALSVQNAVQAAANIWGTSSDEQIHNMAGFIRELAFAELENLQRFDITFADKNVAITLKSVEWWHKHNYGNIQTLLRKLIEDNGGRVELHNCKVWINGCDDNGHDCEVQVTIKELSIGDNDSIVIMYVDKGCEYVDTSDIFSYDELCNILWNACKCS